MAIAAALTVALTVAAATTLLPALLGKAGYRVLRKRDRRDAFATALIGSVAAPTLAGNADGFWARWSRVIERRPIAVGTAAVAVLVALAAPALALRLGSADASSDPVGTATRSYNTTMSMAFGDGFQSQLLLVAKTPDASARTAWAHLVHQLPSLPGVASVGAPTQVSGNTLAMVSLTPTSTGQAKATSNLVQELRSDVITRAETGTHLQVHVGGTTATSIDFANALTSKLPLFLLIIAGLGFLLLTMAFRSLLVPAIGALGNLLTIAVALGATVVLFQWGLGPSFFGIGGSAPVEYIVAMLIVGVMFGLSMDYHVFLVSRMHEEWTQTKDNRRAVSAGVTDTGRVIATAATIMGCVFASFGFAGLRTASEFGVGLAVAVLLDAFLMRMTVIPAVMHKIGARNWALPAWLDRALPQLSVEGPSGAPPAVPPSPAKSLVDAS
jgi:RND superfamily putative drug exporter